MTEEKVFMRIENQKKLIDFLKKNDIPFEEKYKGYYEVKLETKKNYTILISRDNVTIIATLNEKRYLEIIYYGKKVVINYIVGSRKEDVLELELTEYQNIYLGNHWYGSQRVIRFIL